MTRDALKTLFHPFESGDLPVPEGSATVLFLGAEPGFRLPDGFPKPIHCVQGFRPDFLKLQAARFTVTVTPPDRSFDAVLVLAGRHRGQNDLLIAAALERTAEGALILVAGAKDEGIAALRKRLEALVPIDGSMPKHHGIAFWFRRPADALMVATILRSENPESVVEDRFTTAPGMFSHDRVDPGSRLLAEALPTDLSGKVADFCAGWGYLSVATVEKCPAVRAIDLYEADHDALEAARLNMAKLGSVVEAGFFWRDLLTEPVEGRYDAIVMNPPFHAGRAFDPSLGQGMIKAAAAALRKGGRMFLVANRQLPYEQALTAGFSRVERLADESGFKVIAAVR